MSICSFQGTEQGKYFYPDGLKRAFPPLREVMAFFYPGGLKRVFPLLREVMAANPNGLKWTRTTDLTLIRRAL